MTKSIEGAQQHWNDFYASQAAPSLPSQFAVFALNEQQDTTGVLEFGCGNGRDSLFFARQGLQVLGCDKSKAGIEHCQGQADATGLKARFEECDLNDIASVENIVSLATENMAGKVLIYARFFVHAIDEEAEKVLLGAAAKVLQKIDGSFMVEFRTQRDQGQTKVTPSHYRRFVDPMAFAANAAALGLKSRYFVEGFGLAKYKADDAHVARLILSHEG